VDVRATRSPGLMTLYKYRLQLEIRTNMVKIEEYTDKKGISNCGGHREIN
jgi:hypothetical protein